MNQKQTKGAILMTLNELCNCNCHAYDLRSLDSLMPLVRWGPAFIIHILEHVIT